MHNRHPCNATAASVKRHAGEVQRGHRGAIAPPPAVAASLLLNAFSMYVGLVPPKCPLDPPVALPRSSCRAHVNSGLVAVGHCTGYVADIESPPPPPLEWWPPVAWVLLGIVPGLATHTMTAGHPVDNYFGPLSPSPSSQGFAMVFADRKIPILIKKLYDNAWPAGYAPHRTGHTQDTRMIRAAGYMQNTGRAHEAEHMQNTRRTRVPSRTQAGHTQQDTGTGHAQQDTAAPGARQGQPPERRRP